ncbi:MAG: hypothetical protein ACFFF4_11180 [Candidatus Thorarchaeota archaeon]
MTSNPIDEMLELCQALIDMIGGVGACPDLFVMQESFSDAVDKAMTAYKNGEIEVDIRTLPPIMYAFATEELPLLCQGDAEDLEQARKQLNLFMTSVRELVNPKPSE